MISLVIPVFNERESLPTLLAEIDAVCRQRQLTAEVVFIDDGSRDGSWDVIRSLAEGRSDVHGVRFRRNFGKAAALAAGFSLAKGDVVVTLDADLQDDPAEIPNFLAKLDEGFDCVSGWKKTRHDPWHKVYPSWAFNFLVSRLTGVKLHDHNCGMKAYRSAIVKEVRLYGEFHRFVPVLAAGRGFRVGELVIQHRARKFGHSKYGVKRFLKGFLDLFTVRFLTRYGRRPQHFLGGAGFFSLVIGMAMLLAWFACGLFAADGSLTRLDLFLGLSSLGFLLFGFQAIITGLAAELITARTLTEQDVYGVAEHTPGLVELPGSRR